MLGVDRAGMSSGTSALCSSSSRSENYKIPLDDNLLNFPGQDLGAGLPYKRSIEPIVV